MEINQPQVVTIKCSESPVVNSAVADKRNGNGSKCIYKSKEKQ
ncbi:MAG: hypothetical protein ACLUQX_07825 [Thomasclavelia spiroformis]